MSNAGLSGVPIGISCTRCGQPITVDYMAHGNGEADDLISDEMRSLVAAAGRLAVTQRGTPPMCNDCAEPTGAPGNLDRYRLRRRRADRGDSSPGRATKPRGR